MSGNGPQRSGQNATTVHNLHPHYTSIAQDQWLKWADDNGVIAPALILFQWVRTNAPGKKGTNKSLGVLLKDDCIIVKNHTTGEVLVFRDERTRTPLQRRARQAEQQRIRHVAIEQQARHKAAAQLATRLWHETVDFPVFGYFAAKRLSSTHGARWHNGLRCWLVLVTDICGTIYTVQRIYNKPPPNKFWLKGSLTAGGMAIIGTLIDNSRVIVCEGFATTCTVREATGYAVVCAFTCHNLKAVCEEIRAADPGIDLIVAGDDDVRSKHNRGRRMAEEAARAVCGEVCFPIFSNACTACTDFNDVVNCVLCGGAS